MISGRKLLLNFPKLPLMKQYSDLSKLKDLLDHKEVFKLDPKEIIDGVTPRPPHLTVENHMESLVLDIPPEYRNRVARIYQRPKNVMQQGTDNTKKWILEFNTTERWENPNMGWCSSGDSHSNIYMEFPNQCSAICYAKKRGIKWFCEKPLEKKEFKKNYADNFTWNRRTRVSTK